MCTSNVKYTANTGYVIIDTLNPNLDGSGPMGTVLTAGSNGCIVNSIVISAAQNTLIGMVRLFINDGLSSFLFDEIQIPTSIPTDVVPAATFTYSRPITLKSGYSLMASTERNNTFSIIACGMDIESCNCA